MSGPAPKERKPAAAVSERRSGLQTPGSARFASSTAGQHVLGLQAKAGNQAVQRLLGEGKRLPEDLREEMEFRFVTDFSQVRIHDDPQAHASAAQQQAKAFTRGNDIVFGVDRFAPLSAQGRRLLAHELAHVIQQGRGGAAPGGNESSEQAAAQAADAFVSAGGPVNVNGATSVGIARAKDDDQVPQKTFEEHVEELVKRGGQKTEVPDEKKQKPGGAIGKIRTKEDRAVQRQRDQEWTSIDDEGPTPMNTRLFKQQGREDRQGALRRLAYEVDPKIIPADVASSLRDQLKTFEKLMRTGRYDETKHFLRLPKGYVLGHWEGGKFVAATPARLGFDYNNARVITVAENKLEEKLRKQEDKANTPKVSKPTRGQVTAVPPTIRRKQSSTIPGPGVEPGVGLAQPKSVAPAVPAPVSPTPASPAKPAAPVPVSPTPASPAKPVAKAKASPGRIILERPPSNENAWTGRGIQRSRDITARRQDALNEPLRRSGARDAGAAAIGQALGDLSERLNEAGIRARVEEERAKLTPMIKAYQGQHPNEGVLIAVQIATWDPKWKPSDARSMRSFVSLVPQLGGHTKDEAMDRWSAGSNLLQGAGEGSTMGTDFIWIPPGEYVSLSKTPFINGRYVSSSDDSRLLIFQFQDNGSFNCDAIDPRTGTRIRVDVVSGWKLNLNEHSLTMTAIFHDPVNQMKIESEFGVIDSEWIQEHWTTSSGSSGDSFWHKTSL